MSLPESASGAQRLNRAQFCPSAVQPSFSQGLPSCCCGCSVVVDVVVVVGSLVLVLGLVLGLGVVVVEATSVSAPAVVVVDSMPAGVVELAAESSKLLA